MKWLNKRMLKTKSGFTIVELLIVIVIVAILAAISIVAYNGIQDRARQAKIKSDLSLLNRAISSARVSKSASLRFVTGSTGTGGSCWAKVNDTDLASLSRTTDGCWLNYIAAMNAISSESGIDVRNLVDPWGRPYYLDENEDEPVGTCRNDDYGVYSYPFTTGQTMTKTYSTRTC